MMKRNEKIEHVKEVLGNIAYVAGVLSFIAISMGLTAYVVFSVKGRGADAYKSISQIEQMIYEKESEFNK